MYRITSVAEVKPFFTPSQDCERKIIELIDMAMDDWQKKKQAEQEQRVIEDSI